VKAPVDTTRPAAPGSFADKLSGATSGLSADLSDAAHATDRPGGWFSGIVNTLNAREQRLAQNRKNEILNAKNQAETVALHRNLYQQSTATRLAGYKGNQDFVDTYAYNHNVESGVNHDELMKRAQADKNFAKNYFVRATSEEPVLDANGEPRVDKNGNPITSPLYTIVNQATKDGSPDDKTLSEQEAADMNKYLGSNVPKGTKLTSGQYASLNGKLNLARNAVNILNETNEKDLSPEQMKVLKPYLTDETIQGAISHVTGSAYAGLVQYEKNADDHITQLQSQMEAARQKNDQQAYDAAKTQIADLTEEKNKVSQFMSQAINPKQVERYQKDLTQSVGGISEFIKDPSKLQGHAESAMAMADDILNTSKDAGVREQAQRVKDMAANVQKTERQNKIDTAVGEQTAKDLAARIDNNPHGLTGEEFIKTLPVGRANLVRAMAEGRLPVNPNAFERSAAGKPNQLADDVFSAYPDFNTTLGAEWPKAWTNFMINGPDHKKVQAFNVALQHMQNLYDHTTKSGLIPGTADYQARQVDLNYVSREVGNAVSAGVLTQKESDDVLNSLSSITALTPEMKRQRVRETAHLLDAKINEIQREFDAAAPSAAIKTPSLISPAAKASREHVLNTQQTQPAKQFEGKIGVEAGGKTHYFNTQEGADNFKKLAGVK